MRLEKWLEIKNISVSEFAKQIGEDEKLVKRFVRHNNSIPERDVMQKIFDETLGVVSPNDFFRTSPEYVDLSEYEGLSLEERVKKFNAIRKKPKNK